MWCPYFCKACSLFGPYLRAEMSWQVSPLQLTDHKLRAQPSWPAGLCAFPSSCINYSDSLLRLLSQLTFLSFIFFIISFQKNFPEVLNKMALSYVAPPENILLSQLCVTLGMLGKYISLSCTPVHFHSNSQQNLPAYFPKSSKRKKEKSFSECDWEYYHLCCFLDSKLGRCNPASWPPSISLWNALCSHAAEGPDTGPPILLMFA